MADIEQQIQDGVQKALKEKEDKDRFAARFVWALLLGGLSGYVVWSKFWIFSLYENMLFWAIGIGAVVGFFISELLLIAAVALIVLAGYTWLQRENEKSAFDASSNYNLCVKNSTDRLLNVEVRSAYSTKGGKFSGDYKHKFDLKANGYTRLTTGSSENKRDASFGGIYSVIADDGRYKFDPPKYLKLDRDSRISVADTGITIEPDANCAK